MTSNDFIYARKSIRKFKDTPVPTEDLKRNDQGSYLRSIG